MGIYDNNLTALGTYNQNAGYTLGTQLAVPRALTPLTQADQLNNIIGNNPYLSALSQQQVFDYMKTNGLSLNQLQQATATADSSKALAGMIQNNSTMQRPNAWSMEGAFGNKNFNGWAGTAIQGLTALGNLYFGFKSLKQNEKMLNEQIALQRANYRNQARTLNNQYRDQFSGRGYNGQSSQAAQALGKDYNNRKVSETY